MSTENTQPDTTGTHGTGAAGQYELGQYPETIAVVRFGPGTDLPRWAESSSLFTVTATATETTVICAARDVPAKARSRKPLTGFALQPGEKGPRGNQAGVLVELLSPLAEAGIAVDVVTTYDTFWILVPVDSADAAAQEWRRRGHTVAPAVPVY